jgi:hypothetical protein
MRPARDPGSVPLFQIARFILFSASGMSFLRMISELLRRDSQFIADLDAVALEFGDEAETARAKMSRLMYHQRAMKPRSSQQAAARPNVEPADRKGGRCSAGSAIRPPRACCSRGFDLHAMSAISSSPLIERQPQGTPPKSNPPQTTPASTLKSQGVDLKDPVAENTATIIDEVLLRNTKLASYIGDRLKGGFRIAQ